MRSSKSASILSIHECHMAFRTFTLKTIITRKTHVDNVNRQTLSTNIYTYRYWMAYLPN